MAEGTFKAAVLTISDKGYRGQREDTSGPAVCRMLEEAGWEVVHAAILPDEREMIRMELTRLADAVKLPLIVTTGGTGFSPRDITPEATGDVIERLCPGIPETMRAESMKITPHACLSREIAGIRGGTLIINLPGSRKAATENLSAVIGPIRHGVEMLLSAGSADCAAPEKGKPGTGSGSAGGKPSVDAWLQEAKAAPGAEQAGMYLIHNGVVRATARSRVREGDASALPVKGMLFSCDREKAEAAISEARRMEGVCFVKVWVNEGELRVGDDIMQVLIGADIRPHAVKALETLVGRLKNECVTEKELYSSPEIG